MSRTQRGLICVALCLALALVCAAAPRTALADDPSPSGKLDLVILLDNSGSMYRSSNSHNDPESYRYDAAAIMLNMCEASGSRAVIYEFSNNKLTSVGGYQQLTAIDLTDSTRAHLIQQLTQRTITTFNKNGSGNSPLGLALQEAVDNLDAGAETRKDRQPIILILADGDADDPNQLEAAKQACIKQGYKIYTVLLSNDFKDAATLERLARETGGRSFTLLDASELPQQFSQVFADQTGAELTTIPIEPHRVDDSDDAWEMIINIPNRSVLECNIMLPTAGLSDIHLYRPDDLDVTDGNKDVYTFSVGGSSSFAKLSHPRFQQYKIIAPDDENTELGDWRLTFRADSEATAKNISATVVFNYDLSLQYEPKTLQNNKDGNVALTAWFETQYGGSSTDTMLYRGEDGIQCVAYLVNDPKAELTDRTPSVTLVNDAARMQFSGTFRLSDFPEGISGRRKAGTYYVIIKVTGDGLVRESAPIRFDVSNIGPRQTVDTPDTQLLIQDPNAENLDEPITTSMLLSQYFTDDDGLQDIADIQITGQPDAALALAEVVDASDAQNAALKITSAGNEGDTSITVAITDAESETCELVFPVHVVSIIAALQSDYGVEVIAQPPASGQEHYERGESVELRGAYQAVSEEDPSFDIQTYQPQVELYAIVDGQPAEEPLELVDGAATVTLVGDGGDYLYQARLLANGKLIKESEVMRLSTGNVAPNVREGAALSSEAQVGCEKIPDVWLKHTNSEPQLIVFSDIFEDMNAADHLTYAYEIADGEGLVDIQEQLEEGELRGIVVAAVSAGDAVIQLTATDDSNEQASVSALYSLRIIDRHAITMRNIFIALLGLLGLVLLCLIIRKATRPRFRNVRLKVSVDGVPQKDYPLPANVTRQSMSLYTPGGKAFTSAMANGLEIRPTHSGAIICLKNASALRGAVIKVGAKQLGKKNKRLELRRNSDELRAEVGGETMTWKMVSAAPTARRTSSAGPANRSATAQKARQSNQSLYR